MGRYWLPDMSAFAQKKTVIHVASVLPSNSNRLALQCLYARDKWQVQLLQIASATVGDDAAWKFVQTEVLPHRPQHQPTATMPVRRIRSLIRRVVNSAYLHVLLLRSRANLMHAHEHSSLWPLAFWVLVLRRPAVWDPHDFFHEGSDARRPSARMRFRRRLERAVVRRGTPVIAVSIGMREKYEEVYPGADVIVLRNYSSRRSLRVDRPGHEEDRARRLVARRGSSDGGPLRLVYPGLIKPERFSLDLIRMIGDIDGVTLDIYGEDRSTTGVNEGELVRTLSESDIRNVFLKGPYTSDTIVKILGEYHFVLLPYRVTHSNIDFCLPNKFYQCIEAAVPLISSNMKEMGGIISAQGLGFVFPADDEAACIRIIRHCRDLGEAYLALVSNVLKYQLTGIDYAQQQSLLVQTYDCAVSPDRV